jgi:integrase
MKSSKPRKPPAYRLHKPTGQAVVRIDGRNHYLGKHGTEASQEKYRRLIAEWLTAGLQPRRGPAPQTKFADLTINEILLAFWRHAERHYRDASGSSTRELDNFKDALQPLLRLYGHTLAREFGPLALRAVRDEMVRSGLARTTVNARINRVRRFFRWAASYELVPGAVVEALKTVAGLQRGRTDAPEPEDVKPVLVKHVEAVLPYLTRPVAAMVQIQLLTGCRTEEVLTLRQCDLTFGEPNWEYRPASHKNAWRGQDRIIVLGPKAQAIIRPFFRPDSAAYLFSPQDAVGNLHVDRSWQRRSKRTPSELARRCKASPGSKHGARYPRRSYRLAIIRACRKAEIPEWTPLQLRHTAASIIRARFSLEAAQATLGHARRSTTEEYAEPDMTKVHEVMAAIG